MREKIMSSDTTRNSAVIDTIRPETLMDELGIKKTAYYGDLEFLGIKTEKDESGKAFLNIEQANAVRALRSYMSDNDGKREGFCLEGGAIATAQPNSIASDALPPEPTPDPCDAIDHEELYFEASEIAATQMTIKKQVVLAMASQLGYEDLHPVSKAKVDAVRDAASPKLKPQEIAAQLLHQIRQQRSAPNEVAAA